MASPKKVSAKNTASKKNKEFGKSKLIIEESVRDVVVKNRKARPKRSAVQKTPLMKAKKKTP